MAAALALASYIIANLPGWVSAGMSVYELYVKTQTIIDDHKGPGADEWNALDEQAKALQAVIRDTSNDAGLSTA